VAGSQPNSTCRHPVPKATDDLLYMPINIGGPINMIVPNRSHESLLVRADRHRILSHSKLDPPCLNSEQSTDTLSHKLAHISTPRIQYNSTQHTNTKHAIPTVPPPSPNLTYCRIHNPSSTERPTRAACADSAPRACAYVRHMTPPAARQIHRTMPTANAAGCGLGETENLLLTPGFV
jgi:hypothetical protein